MLEYVASLNGFFVKDDGKSRDRVAKCQSSLAVAQRKG